MAEHDAVLAKILQDGEESLVGQIVQVQTDGTPEEEAVLQVARVLAFEGSEGFKIRLIASGEELKVQVKNMQQYAGVWRPAKQASEPTKQQNEVKQPGESESFRARPKSALRGRKDLKEGVGESHATSRSAKKARTHAESAGRGIRLKEDSLDLGNHSAQSSDLIRQLESALTRITKLEANDKTQTWYADMQQGVKEGISLEMIRSMAALSTEEDLRTLKLGLYKTACTARLLYEGFQGNQDLAQTQVAKLATEFDVQKEKEDTREAMLAIQKKFHEGLADIKHQRDKRSRAGAPVSTPSGGRGGGQGGGGNGRGYLGAALARDTYRPAGELDGRAPGQHEMGGAGRGVLGRGQELR